MKVRLLVKEYLDNPRMSLATEEAIFNEVIMKRSQPTLWIWRHANAAVVGRFQIPEEEINMDYAKQIGVVIAKRSTGGGAIYQDLGNLIFSVIIPDIFNIGNNYVEMYKKLINPILKKLKELGVNAESPGLNDLTVNGKKVMGTAATISAGTILFHATLLVKSDLNRLASLLKVPKQKLMDKGVSSVAHRVTNLYDETGIGITETTFIIMDSYAESLGFEYERGDLTKEEKELAKKLYDEKYNTESWIFGRRLI